MNSVEKRAQAELKRLRENKGKEPSDLAHLLYNSTSAYWDLEQCEGELFGYVEIGQLSNICADLGTTARKLFNPAASASSISPDQLIKKITAYLERTKTPLTNFEDTVGYWIGDALADPSRVMAWNLELLQNVCHEIGINWIDALPDCKTVRKYFTLTP